MSKEKYTILSIYHLLVTCCAVLTGLQGVAIVEEEALLVINGIIQNPKHGEVVAVFNALALELARVVIRNVMEEDVHHIVQGHRAGAT